MIELYTGFVGSGKSYCATALAINIIDAPLSKKHVIANFPINERKKKLHFLYKDESKKYIPLRNWTYKTNEEITIDFLINESIRNGWDKKESSCLLIFDEASIPFNSRTFHRSDRLDWIKFLSQSRKFGYDVIFITQDAAMIDKQIRALCEYECQHKKLNNMFALSWLNLFRISLFAQVRFWNGTSARSTKGQLKLYRYKKKVAKRYDTLRIFDDLIES